LSAAAAGEGGSETHLRTGTDRGRRSIENGKLEIDNSCILSDSLGTAMHEMSIAVELLQCVLAETARHGAVRVTQVQLTVGPMRGVVGEAMQLAWQIASENTPAAGSELEIIEPDIQARCRLCDTEFQGAVDDFLCPNCGKAEVDILAGDEILLSRLTCETAEEAPLP